MPDPSIDLEGALRYLLDQHAAVVLLILFASSVIEYIFPPFPGDTVTLAGAVLVTAFDWSFMAVFTAVTLGSIAGSAIDFKVGTWLHHRRLARHGPAAASDKVSILDTLVERFRRHGAAYLVVNRFMPGIRALFFIAAGLAEMRLAPVLLYSAISAAAWNVLVMGLGLLLGDNLDRIEGLVRSYTIVAWVVVAVVVGGFVVLQLIRRARKRKG